MQCWEKHGSGGICLLAINDHHLLLWAGKAIFASPQRDGGLMAYEFFVDFQGTKSEKPLTAAQKKRATLVKKAIKYFEDKSNRSVSEDNLFTRRKNLVRNWFVKYVHIRGLCSYAWRSTVESFAKTGLSIWKVQPFCAISRWVFFPMLLPLLPWFSLAKQAPTQTSPSLL